jgi:hypothetical protein
MNRKPTPEELLRRMLEPFEEEESPEEFRLRVDHELERTLAMTPAEIRADLEAMGYDVAELEREAREFLGRMGWRPPRPRAQRLLSIAAPLAAVATISGILAPAVSRVPEVLPLAAQAAADPPAAVTAAAAHPTNTLEDGGSDDDASSR